MQVNITTIMLVAAGLAAILTLIISRLRKHSSTRGDERHRRSHVFSALAMLLVAVCAFADAAISHSDRYLHLGIGIVLVATAAVVLFNVRKHGVASPTQRSSTSQT